MNTKEYFNLPIACGFTRSELRDIYDALIVSYQEYRNNGLVDTAVFINKLIGKVGSILHTLDDLDSYGKE